MIGAVASVDWGLAVQVMAAASIGSDMNFVPSTGQTLWVAPPKRFFHKELNQESGVYVALLVTHCIICSLATKVLARLQNIYIALNVL